jgi:uncharacterized repeat protein (TIGR03943 family)
MRSDGRGLDPRLVSLGTYFAILLFNAYVLGLHASGQLTLYIHPRYVLFTVAMCALATAACTAGFAITAWRLASAPESAGGSIPWRPSLSLLAAALVLVAAYALPARTLSSDTANQRSDNLNSLGPSGGAGGSADTLAAFSADTQRLTIPDWVSAFNLKADAGFYRGKGVNVVGFVFQPEGAPEDVFYVSRFRVTCCAVDAQPIGLPVREPGWQARFEPDSWVRVTGEFAGGEPAQGVAEPVVVIPEEIEPTEQPRDPYVS